MVRGTVQGVGFRPFVSRLANEIGLTGDVKNTSGGVLIRLFGSRDAVDFFLQRMSDERPSLARIGQIDRRSINAYAPSGFRILESLEDRPDTAIAADAALCVDCLRELFDANDRRFRYPFLNCTQCGPRFSIVQAIPFDRARTTMSEFAICERCRAEYLDPADRRFHAEATACPACGPKLWLEAAKDPTVSHRGDDAIQAALDRLHRGEIIAIKGIGGFHLACRALDQVAVERLRQRKRRARKPLALMVRDRAAAAFVKLSPAAIAALESTEAPIVLAPLKRGAALPANIAPGLDEVGVMLPYTPLHALLFEHLDEPLVMTSGNLTDDPQLIENEAARHDLADIADAFLMHDRPIANRVDDSLVQIVAEETQILRRRARGYAPRPIPLPEGFPDDHGEVLAMGGEFKNAIAIARGGSVTLSSFIGDLEQAKTFKELRSLIDLDLSDLKPKLIAIDGHPSYRSSALGRTLASKWQAVPVEVLHHHAHAVACMVEHGLSLNHPPINAIVLDGLGMGEHGELWGGEILLADYRSCRRLGSLKPAPLLGGDRAAREPWRNLIAQLLLAFGPSELWPTAFKSIMTTKPVNLLTDAWRAGLNAPECTSAGRLFDAVAAALDLVPDCQDYEGEAALCLQALATNWLSANTRPEGYRFALRAHSDGFALIDPAPIWTMIAEDRTAGVPPGAIAARFHVGLAETFACTLSRRLEGVSSIVAMTGGVCQNALLASLIREALTLAGFEVLEARDVPANDGGLAVGQAAIAIAQSI